MGGRQDTEKKVELPSLHEKNQKAIWAVESKDKKVTRQKVN